jgi:hypothetical protein
MVITRSMVKGMDDEYTFEEYNKENLRKTINKFNPQYNSYCNVYVIITVFLSVLSLRYVF